MNGFPSLPIRRCRKTIGKPDVTPIHILMSTNKGNVTIKSKLTNNTYREKMKYFITIESREAGSCPAELDPASRDFSRQYTNVAMHHRFVYIV